jgi:hypothetical protein
VATRLSVRPPRRRNSAGLLQPWSPEEEENRIGAAQGPHRARQPTVVPVRVGQLLAADHHETAQVDEHPAPLALLRRSVPAPAALISHCRAPAPNARKAALSVVRAPGVRWSGPSAGGPKCSAGRPSSATWQLRSEWPPGCGLCSWRGKRALTGSAEHRQPPTESHGPQQRT